MIRKIFLWTLSIWYIIISAINYKCNYPWKLFFYDICSGFRDNKAYLTDILLPVTVVVFVIGIVFVLMLEQKLILHWEIRIRECRFAGVFIL